MQLCDCSGRSASDQKVRQLLKKIVTGQLKQGLRESDTQRISLALIGIGLMVFLRLVRGSERKKIYSRELKAGEMIQLRMRPRP